jgi:hypothetical protein
MENYGPYRKSNDNDNESDFGLHFRERLPFAKTPTALKALKRTLQELLGSGRWYGTLAMGCVIVWIIVTTDPEEMIATEEVLQQEEAKERKRKEKKI